AARRAPQSPLAGGRAPGGPYAKPNPRRGKRSPPRRRRSPTPPMLFSEADFMRRPHHLHRLLAVVLVAVLPLLALLRAATSTPAAGGAPAAKLELRPGDHICLVGNTLAEPMQCGCWLAASIHIRFPKHNLVARNLGFSADELTVRLRSANFGSPDQWLAATRADVVFAFFGYNESFAGKAGLDKFKADL